MRRDEIIAYGLIVLIIIYDIIIITLLGLSDWNTNDIVISAILMIVNIVIEIFIILCFIPTMNKESIRYVRYVYFINSGIGIIFTIVCATKILYLDAFGLIRSAFAMFWVRLIAFFWPFLLPNETGSYLRFI